MFKKNLLLIIALGLSLGGCASVPMENSEKDLAFKEFLPPPDGYSAVYIYRDSFVGKGLKKTITVNDKVIGESADKVFFYEVVTPGPTRVGTESEFSDNVLEFDAVAGVNYFIRQYIKMGVFVGGAALELVDEETGKRHVLGTKLAKSQ